MVLKDFALEKGSSILVTGANGYIASHVVDILLDLGFNVRGTVRERKPWLDQFFEVKHGKGRFESFVLPTLEDTGAFDAAMHGVSGVVHLATDVSLDTNPHKVIPAVQRNTINALAAAAKHQNVKRFVLTSSSNTAIIPNPDEKGITIDENSWNDSIISLAWSGTAPEAAKGFVVYAASKTEGEKAAWKWMAEETPGFVLNTVLPNYTIGKILVPGKISGSTMGFVRDIFKGDYSAMQTFPPQYFVDVRDAARLHVVALLDESVKSERVFAFAREFNWTDVIAVLRKLRPKRDFPDPPANEGRDYTVVAPRARAESLLKSFFGQTGWVDFEQSLAEGIEDIP